MILARPPPQNYLWYTEHRFQIIQNHQVRAHSGITHTPPPPSGPPRPGRFTQATLGNHRFRNVPRGTTLGSDALQTYYPPYISIYLCVSPAGAIEANPVALSMETHHVVTLQHLLDVTSGGTSARVIQSMGPYKMMTCLYMLNNSDYRIRMNRGAVRSV